eukprot:CAMPEP_0168195746 /NCGR_PEP_ID=MMETSP0139_2-20121125/20053_1 /TAXON_ID=44445 /ORGANISM="Pseudo-nitzschia australis, Strain 10249 10 AB" /LENGTH=47 /DNA_ID= /DNA_START= /DNA_END= /DNA_ORIENTATION=
MAQIAGADPAVEGTIVLRSVRSSDDLGNDLANNFIGVYNVARVVAIV